MPLIKKASKKSLSKGDDSQAKPQDQNLAIAYSVQRQSKKKGAAPMPMAAERKEMPMKSSAKSVAEDIMSRKKMADGGMVDLDHNRDEQPNFMDMDNEDILKEHYGQDLDLLDDPMDSNEDGEPSEDEQDRSMVEKIRRKYLSKKD